MKGMIFAAGLGTRLRPLTDDKPKALVEVGGKPMLQRVIEKFKAAGVTDIVVNVHHFAEKIISFLDSNNNFGLSIHVSDERERLLDTGGAILKARRWLDGDEPFMVHNADIVTDFDISAMLREHVGTGAAVTMLVDHRDTSRYLLFDSDRVMRGWMNTKTAERLPDGLDISDLTPLAFGGVHILSPSRVYSKMENFSTDEKFSIIPFYASLCQSDKLIGYTPDGHYDWIDVGRPDTLAKAESLFKSSQGLVSPV